jgi:hypothetical protein
MPAIWIRRVDRFLNLAIVSLIGLGLLLLGIALDEEKPWRVLLIILGFCAFFPGLIYGQVLTILHWKERYRGDHSNLWGVVILVETSGWMKIVYWLRHIAPDYRSTGRYQQSGQMPSDAMKHL